VCGTSISPYPVADEFDLLSIMKFTESRVKRRKFLAGALTPALLPAAAAAQLPREKPQALPRIYLDEFQPKTMLVLPEHHPARARFPVIDVHTHVSHVFGQQPFGVTANQRSDPPADPRTAIERVNQIVRAMDQLNVRMMVNLTGGTGGILKRNIAELQVRHAGRFLVCTEPSYERYADPAYPKTQARELERAKMAGAVGLKVIKSLGLVLREKITEGPLVKVDDPRFDPMWETAGKLNMPVFIHVGDPDAFFLPPDRHNELYEGLRRVPEWSFYGKDFPTKQELLAQLNRVVARHSNTTFVGLHLANHSENLDDVSDMLRRYPNLHCEFAARISDLGRQPRRSQKFFDDFQDRIMFGTDGVGGAGAPAYQTIYRFLETLDDYFDFAAQGRWKIYGLGLSDTILKRVYHDNAARLLGMAEL
jgi:predicted TIM-barrel fold metal-dependent hydrolase